MTDKLYIHYGSTRFDSARFIPIKNREVFAKPTGGLWGSPVDAEFGWNDWCKAEDFGECNDDESFLFALTDTANVLYINSVSDLSELPKIDLGFSFSTWVLLDFEKLVNTGIDAIQMNMSNGRCRNIDQDLYFQMYGWDCDSILVMNKVVIVEK